MPDFSKELETYKQNKDRLIKDGVEGQHVLIKGDKIIGIFPTANQAYEVGLKQFGNVPMFIKQILKDDPPQSAPALFLGLLNASL